MILVGFICEHRSNPCYPCSIKLIFENDELINIIFYHKQPALSPFHSIIIGLPTMDFYLRICNRCESNFIKINNNMVNDQSEEPP